jgi:hypothetical protein
MFGFFKRKKSEEDPLSDIKTVSRWVQGLPAGDIYSAQEQVVQSLIQFNHAGLPMSRDRLQVLMHLDEQSRDMQYSLCMQYLRNPRMSKVIESRLWTAIHAFYWEITRGYHAFLMDFVANPSGSKIQSSIPLITARAIRGFADIFKWRYFRYEKADEKSWLRLNNLYRIAEFEGYHVNHCKLYTNDPRPTSCMEEYLQVLLLSPLGAGSLTPKQIEMIDHWLDNWSDLVRLESNFDPERHFFVVDQAQGFGLRRVRPDFVAQPTSRFVATERLLENIDQTERALKSGAMPASLGLGEEFRLPDGYDLLLYASNEWASLGDKDRRNSPRQSVQGWCEVLHDIGGIHNFLLSEQHLIQATSQHHALSQEELLDIKLYGFVTERTKAAQATAQHQHVQKNSNLERWPIQDRSGTGIGVVLRDDESDWIRVGKLLALREDIANPWRIGIIRRISQFEGNWRKIGIQVMSATPSAVELLFDQEGSGLSLAEEGDPIGPGNSLPALVFPTGIGSKLLFLEASKYSHGRRYRLRQNGEVSAILLESAREKGDGWVLVSYSPEA